MLSGSRQLLTMVCLLPMRVQSQLKDMNGGASKCPATNSGQRHVSRAPQHAPTDTRWHQGDSLMEQGRLANASLLHLSPPTGTKLAQGGAEGGTLGQGYFGDPSPTHGRFDLIMETDSVGATYPASQCYLRTRGGASHEEQPLDVGKPFPNQCA